MKLNCLLKDDRVSRSLLGLDGKALLALEPIFDGALRQARAVHRPQRQRALGAGQKGLLPTSLDKLVFILIYLQCYPTFNLQGVLFGYERSRACRWVHFLRPILETSLGHKCVLPKRQIRSLDEFFCAFPDAYDLFGDVTACSIQNLCVTAIRKKI